MWLKQFVDDHPVEFFRELSKMLSRKFNIAAQTSHHLTAKYIEEIKTIAEEIRREEKVNTLAMFKEIENCSDIEKVKKKARKALGFFLR